MCQTVRRPRNVKVVWDWPLSYKFYLAMFFAIVMHMCIRFSVAKSRDEPSVPFSSCDCFMTFIMKIKPLSGIEE